MNKKIFILFILTALMLLSCVIPVSAATVSTISAGQVECSAGDKIIVPITIDQNSGFVSLSLKVTYDSSVLTLESIHDTGLLTGEYHTANYISPYRLTWENDERTTNISATGKIVELIFRIDEDAANGRYEIGLRMDQDDALDANGNAVSVTLNKGYVTVAEPEHTCSFEEWKPYTSKKHIRYCSDCDEKETESHSFDDGVITQKPTHDAEGEMTYTCEDCGYKKTEEIEPEEHSFGAWGKYDADYHKRTCGCGEYETEAHEWDAGVITKQPTATTAGVKTYTCSVCKETKTESFPNDEVPVQSVSLNKQSIALKPGEKTDIVATILPSNATNQKLIWNSSDDSVVKVAYLTSTPNKGIITAVSEGSATITVTTVDGNHVASCTVTVATKPVDSATIFVDQITGRPGETVKVNIKLQENPGLTSMILKVAYDQSLLTLTDVTYNAAMGGTTVQPQKMNTPVTLYWVDALNEYKGTDIFATLTFTVSPDAKADDYSDITVTYAPDDVFNFDEENVPLQINSGKVTVVTHIPGDINGDGKLNNKDVTRYMQYMAGWDVTVNTYALDINGDGKMNNKDVTRLMQYFAGWNVEIH